MNLAREVVLVPGRAGVASAARCKAPLVVKAQRCTTSPWAGSRAQPGLLTNPDDHVDLRGRWQVGDRRDRLPCDPPPASGSGGPHPMAELPTQFVLDAVRHWRFKANA